jgi:hypothetical protein
LVFFTFKVEVSGKFANWKTQFCKKIDQNRKYNKTNADEEQPFCKIHLPSIFLLDYIQNMKKDPPTIQPDPVPGPDFDPMDWIIENLDNIESFLLNLSMNKNQIYLNSHLPSILALRRTISHQIDQLAEEPYNYSSSRLKNLHEENELIFIYLEGVVGAMNPFNEEKFKKSLHFAEETLTKFEGDLTPP